MSKEKKTLWPYAIGGAITLVFGFCVATVIVTSSRPVENSDTYMRYYQDADADANKIIEARIAFNKKYKIEYLTKEITLDDTKLRYTVTDLSSNPIDNAEIKVIVTRPNNHKHDQELNHPTYSDGVYTFKNIKLPQKGRWDIMAQIKVGDLQRYYSVKVDTRHGKIIEY